MKGSRNRTLLATVTVLLALGCGAGASSSSPPSSPSATAPAPTSAPASSSSTTDADASAAKPFPKDAADAERLKASGVSWSNVEIREYYLKVISGIHAADEDAKAKGVSAEERARHAFETRHNARMTCRAMMADAHEVEDLHARDQAKYGHPDGPVFEQLVDHEKKKGLTGDAVYEAIVASSQRTDGAVNEMLGVAPPR